MLIKFEHVQIRHRRERLQNLKPKAIRATPTAEMMLDNGEHFFTRVELRRILWQEDQTEDNVRGGRRKGRRREKRKKKKIEKIEKIEEIRENREAKGKGG